MMDGRPPQVSLPPRSDRRSKRPPVGSRIAAFMALVVFLSTMVVLTIFTARELPYLVVSVLADGLAISALWIAATNRRYRWWGAVASVLLSVAAIVSLIAAGRGAIAVLVVLIGILAASALGTLALRWEARAELERRWHRVPAARHGVVLMNPRSGDGKVKRLMLADEARRRGLKPILLEPGDDLRALAESAVDKGADALGMAGGDGCQAVVASVAAASGLPFVCIPTGTRNHLAMDLGIDRGDPVGALDAFGEAREAAIDLATVNGEVFANNVSLGVYAEVVASERYREDPRGTVAAMLPDLLGPTAAPFDFTLEGPDAPITDAQVVQVSNNPYTLSSLVGFGSRPSLSTGLLGVATLSIKRTADVNRLAALEAAGHPERYPGWRQWSVRDLEIEGPTPLAAAVDGEARTLESPLRIETRPGALRARISLGQSGASPAFRRAPVSGSTLMGLVRSCGSGVLCSGPLPLVVGRGQAVCSLLEVLP